MKTSILKASYIFAAAFFCFIFSCGKDFNGPVITLEVRSQDNKPVPAVKIALLTNSSTPVSEGRIKTTDDSGKVVILLSINPKAKYVAYLWHENPSKYLYLTNPEATYMAKGTFQSQQEIDASPQQNPQAKVGDIRYIDLNVDGVINEFDKVLPLGDTSVGEIHKTLSVKEK